MSREARPEGNDELSLAPDVRFGRFRYLSAEGRLYRGESEVDLPPRALALLEYFLTRPGELASRERLEAALWDRPPATPRSLNESVMQLRRALDDDPAQPGYVQTVHRRGYRFIAPVEEVPRAAETPSAAPHRRPPRRWSSFVALTAAGLAGLVVGAILAPWAGSAGEMPPESDLQVQLALDAPLVAETGVDSSLAVSADGGRIAYVSRSEDGMPELRLQHLHGGGSRALEETRGRPRNPFFSPDGRWVAYFAEGLLWRVATTGGVPLAICKARDDRRASGTWLDSGRIVFTEGRGSGLWVVSAWGGDPLPLTTRRGGGISHLSPHALPGTTRVVHVVEPPGAAAFARSRIDWVDVESGARGTLVASGGGRPRATRSGLLVFAHEDGLSGVRIDPRTGHAVGAARSLLQGVRAGDRDAAQYDLAADGTLVFVAALEPTLRWVDRHGLEEVLDAPFAPRGFDLAGEGGLLALQQHGDLTVHDLQRHATMPVVRHPAHDVRPVWGPGNVLWFASNRRGAYDVYRVRPGQSAVPVVTGPLDQFPETVSPDGEVLVYSEHAPGTGADLWKVSTRDGGGAEPIARTLFEEREAALSPDGRRLAYVSDQAGGDRVWVRPWDRAGEPLRIPRPGARRPRWSADGSELYFLWRETVWSVRWPDDAAAGLPAAVPASAPGVPASRFAVGSDDRRLLVAIGPEADARRIGYLGGWGDSVLARLVASP